MAYIIYGLLFTLTAFAVIQGYLNLRAYKVERRWLDDH